MSCGAASGRRNTFPIYLLWHLVHSGEVDLFTGFGDVQCWLGLVVPIVLPCLSLQSHNHDLSKVMRVPNASDRQVVVFNQDFVDGKVGLDVLGAARVAGIVFSHVIRAFLWLVIYF